MKNTYNAFKQARIEKYLEELVTWSNRFYYDKEVQVAVNKHIEEIAEILYQRKNISVSKSVNE